MHDYVDEIEHTVLAAMEAAGKQKDEAQQIVASDSVGADEHMDLARAYSLRIVVLKPILAAIKGEIADRNK